MDSAVPQSDQSNSRFLRKLWRIPSLRYSALVSNEFVEREHSIAIRDTVSKYDVDQGFISKNQIRVPNPANALKTHPHNA